MMRFVLTISSLLVTAVLSAQPCDIASVKAMLRPGTQMRITDGLKLTAVVLTSPGNENLADGVQLTYRNCSHTENNRTVYVQSSDGKDGARLSFQHYDPEAKKAQRYCEITLNLLGATLVRSADGSLSICDLPNGCIELVRPGSASALPLKEKTIGELTDEDIYTWVTIKDCEFVFKDGAYVNILEQYSQKSELNKQFKPNNYMDTWQTLLCDRNAAPLYVVINSLTPWRRDGNGVPQGSGNISGILVRGGIPRYGAVNAWQIRPQAKEDIAFEWKGTSSFNTLCEWNWNDNSTTFKTDEGPVESFTKEKMLPDIGAGELTLGFTGTAVRGIDTNNPVLEPTAQEIKGSKGLVRKGSMEIRTQVRNWWNWGEDCGNAVLLKFSTKDIKAEKLVLAFSFSAGANFAAGSRFNPAYWGVELSTDNVHITRLNVPDIRLKSLPWWEKELDDVRYFTSADAGLGFTEHMVELPSSFIGQETVYVRICPVSKNLMTLAMEDKANYSLRQNFDYKSYVSFGAITVRYR